LFFDWYERNQIGLIGLMIILALTLGVIAFIIVQAIAMLG